MSNLDTKAEGTASVSRRDFLGLAASAVAGSVVGVAPTASHAGVAAKKTPRSAHASGRRPNIVFVFTDQERYFQRLPKGFELPAHERLARKGVTFTNHYCPAVMCTSSRAVLLTGLQTADNRMFENADMPYVKALAPDIPTIGHMLRGAGYYTAYKGKWHLDAQFDAESPDRLFTREMDAYGFSDYVWPGDVLVHTLGGYKHDQMIAGSALSWLREKAEAVNEDGKPWALFVSLVNPHDIMYFNTDHPGESVQDTGHLLMHGARAPKHAIYEKKWGAPLPRNLRQSLTEAGRPKAHVEFDRAWGYTLGRIPLEDDRWQRFSDFYLNSMRSVDVQVGRILDELEALGQMDNTIVVFTSDHGEMGGAHGLRGKGPFAYEESIHVPLYVIHPDVQGGQSTHALTGHIDLAPTLLSMAGVPQSRAGELAHRDLPGVDFSSVVSTPRNSHLHSVRDAVLFTYSGIATNDSEVTRLISEAKARGEDPKAALKASGYKPNLKARGSVRTVFDGRYKFSRYFAPTERNRPTNLEELFGLNDVELFDLKSDPSEMKNLAMQRDQHAALIGEMSAKLEKQIKHEIGVDDGREMPDLAGVSWAIDRLDL